MTASRCRKNSLRVGGHATGEPLVVQKLQQGREALRVAVVGRGRQEELVLEVRGQEADRPGAERVGGVLAPPGRGAVVGLVHDQHVVAAGVDRLPLGRERLLEQPQGPLPLEEVDRGDQPGEVGPRVDVDAPPAPQVPHQLAVDDAEVEPELVPHLVPPLDLERGRADDEDPPGPVPDDQLEGDEPRLDGLAEPHVVGDQQVDPRHLDGPDHGVELVVLDVDARAERGLDVLQVGRGSGPPADGIEEGVEPLGGVEAGRLGQGDLLDDLGPRLDLPDDLKLFAEGVVLDGQQGDEVLGPFGVGSSGGGGSVLARTSPTTQRRDRTLTSWPCSGNGESETAISPPRTRSIDPQVDKALSVIQ